MSLIPCKNCGTPRRASSLTPDGRCKFTVSMDCHRDYQRKQADAEKLRREQEYAAGRKALRNRKLKSVKLIRHAEQWGLNHGGVVEQLREHEKLDNPEFLLICDLISGDKKATELFDAVERLDRLKSLLKDSGVIEEMKRAGGVSRTNAWKIEDV